MMDLLLPVPVYAHYKISGILSPLILYRSLCGNLRISYPQPTRTKTKTRSKRKEFYPKGMICDWENIFYSFRKRLPKSPSEIPMYRRVCYGYPPSQIKKMKRGEIMMTNYVIGWAVEAGFSKIMEARSFHKLKSCLKNTQKRLLE